MRKDVGLSVSQCIELGLGTDAGEMRDAICEHREYIMDEVLAVNLEMGALEGAKASQELTVEGHVVRVTMRW
jgi:hypothetical protein